MLVLSRKVGERIQVGPDVTLTVLGIRGGAIRLGFEGPANVPIHREEVAQRIEREVRDDRAALDRRGSRVGARIPVLRAG
ncbi:MAG: carbon storage regulator CsrA [Candidatus Paceibacterota bacterium]